MKTRTAVKAIAAALLLAVATPVWADKGDIYLEGTLTSLHFPRDRAAEDGLNERNFGMGVAYGVADWLDARLGFFDNTYHKTSIYAGVNIKRKFYLLGTDWFVAPVAMLGVVSGYEDTPVEGPMAYGLRPMLVPGVQIGQDDVFATIGFIPALNDTHYTTLTFQITVKLGNIRGR